MLGAAGSSRPPGLRGLDSSSDKQAQLTLMHASTKLSAAQAQRRMSAHPIGDSLEQWVGAHQQQGAGSQQLGVVIQLQQDSQPQHQLAPQAACPARQGTGSSRHSERSSTSSSPSSAGIFVRQNPPLVWSLAVPQQGPSMFGSIQSSSSHSHQPAWGCSRPEWPAEHRKPALATTSSAY